MFRRDPPALTFFADVMALLDARARITRFGLAPGRHIATAIPAWPPRTEAVTTRSEELPHLVEQFRLAGGPGLTYEWGQGTLSNDEEVEIRDCRHIGIDGCNLYSVTGTKCQSQIKRT